MMGPIEFLAEDWRTQRHTLCSGLAEIDFTTQFRMALLLMVTVAVVPSTGVQKPQGLGAHEIRTPWEPRGQGSRPMPRSAIIREVSSSSRWEQYRDPHLGNVQRVRDLGTSTPKRGISISPSPQGSGRKSGRDSGDGGHQGITAFWLGHTQTQRLRQHTQGPHGLHQREP